MFENREKADLNQKREI